MNVLPIYYLLIMSFFGLKPNEPSQCYFKTAIGEQVPDFEFTTLDKRTLKISDYRGKLVLISLFGTYCPPCLEEMPLINKRIFNKHKNQNFVLLAIGATDDEERMLRFKEKYGYDFTFVADPEQEIFNLFADCNIPRNLVIDANGKILFQVSGYNKTPFERMVKLIDKELQKT